MHSSFLIVINYSFTIGVGVHLILSDYPFFFSLQLTNCSLLTGTSWTMASPIGAFCETEIFERFFFMADVHQGYTDSIFHSGTRRNHTIICFLNELIVTTLDYTKILNPLPPYCYQRVLNHGGNPSNNLFYHFIIFYVNQHK